MHSTLPVTRRPGLGRFCGSASQIRITGQPHFPYEEDSEASYLAHPHTPPVHLPMLEGVQPAGYDYHYLGLGWGNGQISQGGEGSQHEDPLAAPV